ncbi:putative Ctr copper transporter family-domain-containing protein [Seiridium cardinale]|uniref:Copper transport protein n=1 Tax=Seiridium cardinale TaxID=138064 RepID=A0ABR2Y9D5_9PEZI
MSGMTMTSSSAMSTSTAMDMDMSSDSSILMTSAEMAMVFFQSATTPLYSSAWTPSGQGPYAGTCVFLIVLATIHRILHAIKSTVFDGRPQDRHAPLASQNGEVEGVKTAGRQLKRPAPCLRLLLMGLGICFQATIKLTNQARIAYLRLNSTQMEQQRSDTQCPFQIIYASRALSRFLARLRRRPHETCKSSCHGDLVRGNAPPECCSMLWQHEPKSSTAACSLSLAALRTAAWRNAGVFGIKDPDQGSIECNNNSMIG